MCLWECVLWCLDTCFSQTQHCLFLPAYKYTEMKGHKLTHRQTRTQTRISLPFQNNCLYFHPPRPHWYAPPCTHIHKYFCCLLELTHINDLSFDFSQQWLLPYCCSDSYTHSFVSPRKTICNLTVLHMSPTLPCFRYCCFGVGVSSPKARFENSWLWCIFFFLLHLSGFSLWFFLLSLFPLSFTFFLLIWLLNNPLVH